jgi:hypothetical protein
VDCTASAEEKRRLKTEREEIEDAIDLARGPNGVVRALELIVMRMAHRKVPALTHDELQVVREKALLAIIEKFDAGATTSAIANQLDATAVNKARDVQAAAISSRDHMEQGDPVVLLKAHPSPLNVATAVEEHEDYNRVIDALAQLRDANERYYEVIMAQIDGFPIPQRLKNRFNEDVTDVTARKLLQRARERFETILSGLAKATAS